jgi:hypothetical protein
LRLHTKVVGQEITAVAEHRSVKCMPLIIKRWNSRDN